jgi:hypothetical protein
LRETDDATREIYAKAAALALLSPFVYAMIRMIIENHQFLLDLFGERHHIGRLLEEEDEETKKQAVRRRLEQGNELNRWDTERLLDELDEMLLLPQSAADDSNDDDED